LFSFFSIIKASVLTIQQARAFLLFSRPKKRTGDFSELCETGFTAGVCNHYQAPMTHEGTFSFTPVRRWNGNQWHALQRRGDAYIFTNNQIPIGMIDPVAQGVV